MTALAVLDWTAYPLDPAKRFQRHSFNRSMDRAYGALLVPDAETPIKVMQDHYMRGHCSVFALTLYERTGWPICGIYSRPDGAGNEGSDHVFCRDPSGFYVDAIGWRSYDQMKAAYQGPYRDRERFILQTTPQDIASRFYRDAEQYPACRRFGLPRLLPDVVR